MKNSKQIFKALPENAKLQLIEKVMPHSGLYRQLDNQGDFSDGQMDQMASLFVNSKKWARGIEVDEVSCHDKAHVVNTDDDFGNEYEAIGFYSDDELLYIEDLECINETFNQ